MRGCRCWGVGVLGYWGVGAGMGARWFSMGTRIFSPLKGPGIYSGIQPRQRKFNKPFHCLRHLSRDVRCDSNQVSEDP